MMRVSVAMAVAWGVLLVAASGSVRSAPAAGPCKAVDPEVYELFEAMATSARDTRYSGVVTLQRGGDMQVMRLSHNVHEGAAREQLSRLTGQDVSIERAGRSGAFMHPGQRLLQADESAEAEVCGLGESYRFRLMPGERVAGRDALRVRVEPLDMYRFGYIFELDRETALMLKSTTLTADQRILEQFQFASLEMMAGNGAVEASKDAATLSEAADYLRTGAAWQVDWLPTGFLPTDAAPFDSQRKSYTDGLASFSVFLEPLGAAIKPGEGVERQGSTVAYTRGVMLQSRPVLVTVLGEIPTNTARMVADSVRLR